jgi:hypothetical protein
MEALAGYGIRKTRRCSTKTGHNLLDSRTGRLAELPIHWCLVSGSRHLRPDTDLGHTINGEHSAQLWIEDWTRERETRFAGVLTCNPFCSGRPSRLGHRAFIDFAEACASVGQPAMSWAETLLANHRRQATCVSSSA